MKEWDAGAYDKLSEPQQAWGRKVLDRIDLRPLDREGVRVLDVGAGTGKLTAQLAARLPRARVIVLDRSAQMIEGCRGALASLGDRVSFLEGDVLDLTFADEIDLVFSTATFHWVLDHARLFRVLGRALRVGGRLEAQCGGEGNLRATLARSAAVLAELGLEQALAGERYPACFAPVDRTQERLRDAGFTDLDVSLEDAPTLFPDRDTFRAFLATVVLRTVVARLAPDEAGRYLDRVVEVCEGEVGWQLDYVRLNLRASRGPGR